jgi:hypothetical protein
MNNELLLVSLSMLAIVSGTLILKSYLPIFKKMDKFSNNTLIAIQEIIFVVTIALAIGMIIGGGTVLCKL